ncbi:two-component system response regulator NatR [Nemorincola caseinilytica]|uniref:Two-component system response regulator NatR n=1 Tax=Nemorincola caseinilytica TaxID=2054315 RepID=A0ABP8N5H1_9BACT
MNQYRCAIVDDERDAIELLSSRIEQLFGNIEVADTFSFWKDALPALRNNNYDILFIDVSMPEKSGFDLLKLLPGLDLEIIFVTAHDNFALKAFSFSATGYVLKPIDDEELSTAINKALERINNKHAAKRQTTNLPVITAATTDKVRIPNNSGIDYVNVNDIIYLESVNKCTIIVTGKAKYTSSANLGTYKYLTDDHSFFQVHRAFIINLNCVVRYESAGVVVMQDKTEVPIARNIRQEFLQLFDKK